MGASLAWNRSDVAGLLRLLNRLHTTPASEAPRPRLLLQGACELLGAPLGLALIGMPENGAWRADAAVHIHGRDAHSVRPLVASFIGHQPADPALRKLLKKLQRRTEQSPLTAARADLIKNDAWYNGGHVREVRRALRIDDALYSACRLASGQVACVTLCREWDDRRKFNRRDRQTLHLLHEHTAWVHNDEHSPASFESLPLSPREKQTLWKLLAGRGEKQIAAEMRLSRNTVHHYVKSIYRHFGVSSRAELLARWMER